MSSIQQTLELKLSYGEILQGYSTINSSLGLIFVRHLSQKDGFVIDNQYQNYFKEAVNSKLPTNQDRENYIIEQGLWSKDKDSEISSLKYYIKNLKVTKSKLFKESDLNQLNKQIKENEDKILNLERQKIENVGLTAEIYATSKINEYYVRHLFFKDINFTINVFTDESFEDLDDYTLNSLIDLYNVQIFKFNEQNLRKIAISSFFLNFFFLAEDNIFNFYGKPIIELSFYQLELFQFGKYFKSLLSDVKTKPPDDIMDDPDKFVEWHDSVKNASELLEKNQNKNQFLVGVTNKDQQKLGLSQNVQLEQIATIAAKKGGTLEMEDFIKMEKN